MKVKIEIIDSDEEEVVTVSRSNILYWTDVITTTVNALKAAGFEVDLGTEESFDHFVKSLEKKVFEGV